MEKTRTTPFRPKSDVMIERANQTIQNMLSAFINPMQRDWDTFLSVVMMAYRSSVHEATKVSPSYMMLGREITLPIDLIFGEFQHEKQTQFKSDYAFQLAEQIRSVHEYARENLKITAETMKRRYDENINFHEYIVGDAV